MDNTLTLALVFPLLLALLLVSLYANLKVWKQVKLEKIRIKEDRMLSRRKSNKRFYIVD